MRSVGTGPGRSIIVVEQLYRAASISNVIVSIPAFLSYRRYVAVFSRGDDPNYPFLVRIWAGMALLWGASFWEIARDPVARRDLIKYSWMEKLVTSVCVLDAYRRGEVPLALVALVFGTDVAWIPPFIWAQRTIS
jgi:hypothetical protein